MLYFISHSCIFEHSCSACTEKDITNLMPLNTKISKDYIYTKNATNSSIIKIKFLLCTISFIKICSFIDAF